VVEIMFLGTSFQGVVQFFSHHHLIMSALDFSFPLRQTRLLSTFSTKQNHLGITSHLGQLSLLSFRGW